MKSMAGKSLKLFINFFLITVAFSWGCKKAYNPQVVSSANNYLVVEAVINTGTDSSVIKLSRTVPISTAGSSTPETGAVVSIISDANVTYPVVEKGNGVYMGTPINAASIAKYMLKITTSNGKSYQSDLIQAKNSPPIDSVYFRVAGNGINIYADTHDPSNNTRYYRWDFNDTYIFTSAFYSYGMVVKDPADTVVDRPPALQINQCWRSDTSTSIIINSSAKLTNDVISENLVTALPLTAEQLEKRYSILVNQYALVPDAYNYYQQLKKNSESLGTIFDPQPAELPGNVHSVSNPSEVVIGYITAGTPAKTRIYINNRDIPYAVPNTPYIGCSFDTLLYKHIYSPTNIVYEIKENIYTGREDPISPISNRAKPGAPPIGWTGSSPLCVDCTLRGTNQQPAWWINDFN